MPSPAASAPELLGRQAELATLEAALEAARAGRGGLALVTGEAGMGKSTLCEVLKQRAEGSGFSVVVGRAWEFADAPPWFPLRTCLRSLGVELPASLPGSDDADFSLWERVLEALALTTRETPALWIVEDVHAADLHTLDLLFFLTTPLKALSALVVVTTRPDDPRLSDRMRERLLRMARDGVDLRVEPLGLAEVEQLVRRVVRGDVSPAVARELLELSGGNPLFVVEYARAFQSAKHHQKALLTLPPTIRQVVLERARWLPDATQRMLSACSVLGRDFSAALAARMLELLPARVIDALIPALSAGIVLESAPGQFRFSHALVRDAFYEGMNLSERTGYHARAAAMFPASEVGDRLMMGAQHALLGLPLTDQTTTLGLTERAVAALEAQRAYDRAFALQKQVDAARREGLLPVARPEQLRDSARLARAAGRFTEARAICEELLLRARSEQNATELAEAALLLGAALQPGVVDPALVLALEDAERALGDSDPRLACLVRARLAAALQPAPDPQGPIRMAREEIARARQLGDAGLLREVLYFAGSALVDLGPVAERLACAEELLELSEATGDRERALRATLRLALDHAGTGDFRAFSHDVDRALALSDALGRAPRHRWRPLLLVSMRAAAHGDFQESERAIVEVTQLVPHCDDPALRLALPGHQLMMLRLQRKDAAVKAMLPEMQALLKDAPLGPAMLAMLRFSIFARMEDEELARAELGTVAPYVEKFGYDPDFCALVAEGVALVGSDDLRRLVRERLRGGMPELNLGHVMMGYEGPTRRVIAALDAALGEPESALGLLRETLETAQARGHRPWVAQIEYDLGKLLQSRQRHGEALAHLERAARLSDELGIEALARQARARLGSLTPPSDHPAPEPEPVGLKLTREGESWRVHYGARSFTMRDTRGMQLLARLVERPDEELHVLALSGDDAAVVETDAGEHLDEAARSAYRKRLLALESAIDDAQANADLGRVASLGREREMLVAELARAVGLGGRARRAGSATERARSNVQKRLKQAVAAIEQVDRETGLYLSRALRTGAFCSFRP